MAQQRKRVAITEIKVEHKQLNQALVVVNKLTTQLAALKKEGKNVRVIADTERQLRAATKAAETLRTETTKRHKETYPLGVKQLELSKLQLQKIKEQQKAEAAKAREKAKADREAQKALEKQLREEAKATAALEEQQMWMEREAKTLEELSKKTAVLAKARRQLDLTNEDNIDSFNKLTAEIAKNQEQINSYNEQIGRHQGNVGNYASMWEGMPSVFGQVSDSVGQLGNMFTALLANPVVAMVAALVAGLSFLFNQFMQTERGTQIFNRSMDYLNASLDTVTAAMRDLGNFIANLTWDDVTAKIKAFGKELLNGNPIVVAFKSSIETFSKLLRGDFSGAWDSIVAGVKDFGVSIAKTAMPLLNAVGGFDSLTESVTKTANGYKLLREQQLNVRVATMALDKEIAKARANQELYQAVVDDDLRSFPERIAAIDKLTEASAHMARLERANAENALMIAKAEQQKQKARGISFEAMLEYTEKVTQAEIALIEANNAYTLTLQANSEKIKRLKQDEAEAQLDVLFDVFDKQKTINEAVIASELSTAEQSREILRQTKEEADRTTAEQLEIFKRFTNERIDLDAILAETNVRRQLAMIEELKLSEIMQNRFRELVQERMQINYDLAQAEQDIRKKEADERQKAYDAQVKDFERRQELQKLEFEAKNATQEEQNVFEIEQKLEHDQMLLELAESHGMNMNELERSILEQRIANYQADLAAATDTTKKKLALKKAEEQGYLALLGVVKMAFGEQTKAGKIAGRLEKALALRRIFVDNKVALAKAWASAPFPANLPIVAQTLAQTGLITAAVNAVKFRTGGQLPGGVVDGPSHENGGVKVLGGMVELEGDEYIVNREATRMFLPLLNAINSFGLSGRNAPPRHVRHKWSPTRGRPTSQSGHRLADGCTAAARFDSRRPTRHGSWTGCGICNSSRRIAAIQPHKKRVYLYSTICTTEVV